MKKFIATIIGLALLIPYASAYFEQTISVNVLSGEKITRNFVIEYSGSKYVIHYNGSCSDAVKNGKLTINVRSVLDGIGDEIIENSYTRCQIDQAEVITGLLYVQYVHGLRNFATVNDEAHNRYDMSYGDRCSNMDRYVGSYVYLRKFGSYLNKGDIVYLPRNEGYCGLLYVDRLEDILEEEAVETGDTVLPNKIYNVVAVPGNGRVYLSWRKAYDNVGIDHYIISYSPYSLNTREYNVKDMPNQITTTETSYAIEGLRNETYYYFYVIAVDTSGNYGTLWSYEAKAMPRSSISEPPTIPVSLRIIKRQETENSFLFSWERIGNAVTQNVSLTANGQSEFFLRDWTQDYIRVLKTDSRKGKRLVLKVHVYDGRDLWHMDEIEFSF